MIVKAGSTDVTTYFVIRTAADGTATTGATITNIDLQYVRSGAAPAAKVDATALATTDAAHGDNKAIEVDATDAPGLYRVDWPDAAFAAGVREVILTVKLASSFTEHLRVELSPAVDAVAISGDATAADDLELLVEALGTDDKVLVSTDAQDLSGTLDVNTKTITAGAVNAAAIANAAIDAATFAADVDAEILSYIVDDATKIDASALNTASGLAAGATGFAAIDTVVDTILTDTGELQTDWTNGGRLDLILDIIAADTTTDIPALIATAQADLDILTGADGVNLLSATQASIDAIEADTNEVQGLAAGATGFAAIDTVVDAVLVDTNELQADWTNGGRLDLIVDAILADTNELQTDDIPTSIAALQTDLDSLTDAYSEPGQGAPGVSETLLTKVAYLYKSWRNKKRQDADDWDLYADDATTVDQNATISDDGTDAIKGEIGTGA